MSKIKIGINGFGRIGRLVFRAAMAKDNLEIVGINDLISVDYMAYMLRYDTMHGQFKGTIEVKENALVVNGHSIRVTAEKDPANLKWNEVGAEYVVESTGLFLTKEKSRSSYQSGRETRRYVGSVERRYPDVRNGREQQNLRRSDDRFERILHHELSGSDRQSAER